jgi:predicted lipid-binding transport protein (Tim44 family)
MAVWSLAVGRWLTPRKKMITDLGVQFFFVAIALAGILSGIFLFSLSMLLFHFLLQRRRARPHNHHQQASSSSRRRSHRPRSDSESDLASEDAAEEKEGEREKNNGSRASSLNLEPNQPLYVDVVEAESERGSHTGLLQFILTPPTPGR